MSMPTPDNPHTERLPIGAELEFWSDVGSKASGRIGADVVVVYQPGDRGRHQIANFQLPAQERELERLIWMLERAFQFGRRDKAKEVRKVLGL